MILRGLQAHMSEGARQVLRMSEASQVQEEIKK